MDSVIIQSQELKEQLPGINKLKTSCVIPVGYNGRLFYPLERKGIPNYPQRSHSSDNHIVVAYNGTMDHFRQLDKLIAGFAQAVQIYEDLLLLMMGDGPAIMDLRAQARSLGIEKNIVFTGMVPHESMLDYLGIVDIGLSFVPINENYTYNPPLKTFEYLACGLPVIATRTVSNTKIVSEGFNGLLIDDTAESLCEAIVSLARDPGRLADIKVNTRKSVESFDFEKITRNKMIPLYMELLCKKGLAINMGCS